MDNKNPSSDKSFWTSVRIAATFYLLYLAARICPEPHKSVLMLKLFEFALRTEPKKTAEAYMEHLKSRSPGPPEEVSGSGEGDR